LTPEQAIILPISEKYHNYAKKVSQLLENSEIRTLIDERAEKIGRKIRDAEVSKIPFMIIVGEKEEEESKISIRKHGQGDLGSMEVKDFVNLVSEEVSKTLEQFK
jgi:threonyl-tRNA synthetase